MNKNLLALAVSAAVMVPAAASADAKIYGRVQAEYSVEDIEGSDSVQGVDDDAGQSRLGFKVSEKLGGGLTAIAQVEFGFDPADHGDSGASTTVGQRLAFVGLKGSWGTFRAGSIDSPYKTAGGVKWDPWAATHLQARRAGGMTGGAGVGGHNGYMTNALYYTSPKVNGFQVKFAISPDETNAAGTENASDDSDNDYSLAVEYSNGPWNAIFAHNRNNNGSVAGAAAVPAATGVYFTTAGGAVPVVVTAVTSVPAATAIVATVQAFNAGSAAGAATNQDDETLTKLGLRWKNGPWTVAGQYEMVKDADRAATGSTPGPGANFRVCSGCDADVLWLNAQYKAGNNTFSVSYGNTDVDVSGGNDYEHDMWTVGVIHQFSKKSRVFAGYTQSDGDDDAQTGTSIDRDAWSVGIRQDF